MNSKVTSFVEYTNIILPSKEFLTADAIKYLKCLTHILVEISDTLLQLRNDITTVDIDSSYN